MTIHRRLYRLPAFPSDCSSHKFHRPVQFWKIALLHRSCSSLTEREMPHPARVSFTEIRCDGGYNVAV